MSDEGTALGLLAGLEFEDTRLYSLLDILIRDFYSLDRQVNPVTSSNLGLSGIQIPTVDSVSGFIVTIFTNNVRLSWDALTGASYYEIRYLAGSQAASAWSSANSILRTSTLSADINPVAIPLTYGNHTFFIKATNNAGTSSSDAAIVVINVPQIEAPVIASNVIDNNVLLKWTTPTSIFHINYYNIYKDGTIQGVMNGTFEAIFETTAGTYTYKIEAVDLAGNVSTSASVILYVNQPPDFELQDDRVSDLDGDLVNVLLVDGPKLLCNLNLTETFAEHFTDNGWTTVQDQIDAGYPFHCQPTETTGTYEETIDYGVLLSNVIASINWSELVISAGISVQCEMVSSSNGFGAYTVTTSLFSSSMDKLKFKLTFTGATAAALSLIDNIRIRLDVKREMDAGEITALAIDGDTGTAVTFNKAFKDIDSITLTVAAQQPITTIYKFVDIPDPTTFYVLAFDSSGNQVDYLVSWKARGVV